VKFIIGDIVSVKEGTRVGNDRTVFNVPSKDLIGIPATVLGFKNGGTLVGVKFHIDKAMSSLHSCGTIEPPGRSGRNGYCWFLDESLLRFYEETTGLDLDESTEDIKMLLV